MTEQTSIDPNSSETTALAYLRRPAILLSGIALITLLLYISTLSFEFVWDDHVQVESNPLLLSWREAPRAFHSSLWFQMTPEGKGSYYRPFFILWSIFNHSLFGFRPWGWHLTNVLLHIMASCLIFVLLRRMNVEYWCSAIAAMAFAIHPVHIEPVAWISAGADTLAALLYLLTFLAFLQWRESQTRRRIGWMLASLVLFACALLTKEMAVTLPVILVLYLWFFPRDAERSGAVRRVFQSLLTTLPYAILNVLYLAERARVLHGFSQTQKNYGPVTSLLTLPMVLMNDLRILIFPGGLTGFYYTAYVRDLSFTRFVFPATGLVLVAGLVWWWSRRERDSLIAFFALWIPVCLLPVLYLPAFKDGDFVRDRYLYLPSVGFAFLLAKALRRIPTPSAQRGGRWLQPAAIALICVAFAFGVLTQQVYWANDLLVFHRGHALDPQNTTAMQNLASVFNQRGDPASAMNLLQQAVTIDPGDSYTHWLLAIVESQFHQNEKAEEELATAVNLSPQYYLETSHGLSNLGHAFATAHDYVQAERCLRRALEIEPESTSSLVYMGMVLLRTDRTTEAETYLRKAASLDPDGYDVNWTLGMLAQMRGDRALAEQKYYEELRLHPGNRSAQLSLTTLHSGK